MIEQQDLQFKQAYTDNGTKVSHRRKDYFNYPGVYVIKIGGIIRYVGRSGVCVYRACYRHFQKWCKKPRSNGQMDRHYKKAGAEVAIIKTADYEVQEIYLTHQLNPTDNRFLFGLPEKQKPKRKKSFWGRNYDKEYHSTDYDYIAQCEADNGIENENY